MINRQSYNKHTLCEVKWHSFSKCIIMMDMIVLMIEGIYFSDNNICCCYRPNLCQTFNSRYIDAYTSSYYSSSMAWYILIFKVNNLYITPFLEYNTSHLPWISFKLIAHCSISMLIRQKDERFIDKSKSFL